MNTTWYLQSQFLDTEVFVESNFGYTSPRLASVAELAQGGRVRVFLTELTVREIKAKIREAIERAASTRPQPILRNSSLPQVKALFEPLDTAEVEKELVSQLEAFIKQAGITVLPIEDECLEPVLDNYFNRLPPFGTGKNKAEFPDALALETLREWCSAEGFGMAVVTRDEGMRAACSDAGALFHFEDLPKYLGAVASEDAILADFIREMIVRHDTAVFEGAKESFGNLGFYLTDQDGDAGEVELTGIDYDGDVEINLAGGQRCSCRDARQPDVHCRRELPRAGHRVLRQRGRRCLLPGQGRLDGHPNGPPQRCRPCDV